MPQIRIAALTAATLLSTAASADWSYDFVRMVCVPESGYVQIEYRSVSGPAVLTDAQHDDEKRQERLRIWERHGFLDPHKLNRSCSLRTAGYAIETAQELPLPSGTCGGAPQITLNVKRNGVALFKDVPLGYNCIRGPSVASIEISEPPAGWGTRTMTLCTFDDAEQTKCKYFSADDIVKATPITEALVREYANER